METIYNVDFFINKFKRIPGTLWCIGTVQNDIGQKCAQGHCGVTKENIVLLRDNLNLNAEVAGLSSLFNSSNLFRGAGSVRRINNGDDPRYQQPTPKQRILQALKDIKSAQEKAQQPEVKEKVRYVTVEVDSSVRELQQKELSVN